VIYGLYPMTLNDLHGHSPTAGFSNAATTTLWMI